MEGGPCRASPGQGVTDHRTQPLGSGPVLLPHPHLIPLPPTVILGPSSVSRHQHPGGRTGITDSPSGQCSFQATLCSSGGQIQVFWLQDPGHQSPSVIPVATGLPSGHRPPLGPASSGGSLKPHSCPSLTSHRSGQERFRPQQPGTTAWAH